MADANKYINAVPFPLAGEGAVLRYRTFDLIKIEEIFGESFAETISKALNNNSSTCMVECLKHGLKHADGRTAFSKVDWNDLPFSVHQAREAIFDAISCAITGQSFAAILEARQKLAEGGDEPDPQMGLETEGLSAASSGPEIEPASAGTTSSS
jgi:hypothetical protein